MANQAGIEKASKYALNARPRRTMPSGMKGLKIVRVLSQQSER
jgi:hypothetical protein